MCVRKSKIIFVTVYITNITTSKNVNTFTTIKKYYLKIAMKKGKVINY